MDRRQSFEKMLKITVLDAKPLDAGDIDWEPLRRLGSLTLHDNTRPDELSERVRSAVAVLFTNKVRITREAIEAAPQLKMIGVLATGYDNIDLEAARARKIVVCNVPHYSTAFTAQSTLALLLELTNHVGAHSEAVHQGEWTRQEYFSFWKLPLTDLDGKTLLIIGLGNIGRRFAKIARALGMHVFAAQLPGRSTSGSGARVSAGKTDTPYIPLEEGLQRADVVSLHCPLTPQTQRLVDVDFLSKMKESAFLLNASRGGLVDEEALAAGLRAGQIAGYGADVLSAEPPAASNPLLSAPRCVLTPHLGWASIECRQKILDVSAENLKSFLQGEPQNRIV